MLYRSQIWFSYLPNIVITQLLKLNFEGKTIYPFNTHETSGIGNSNQEIKLYTPGAIVKKGFAIKGSVIRINKEDSMKEIRGLVTQSQTDIRSSERHSQILTSTIVSIVVVILLSFLNH